MKNGINMSKPIINQTADSAVNHPRHYNSHPSGVECIDVVEHMPFNLGNAVKYLWRAGLKSGQPTTQDLQKAVWYIQREIGKVNKDAAKSHERRVIACKENRENILKHLVVGKSLVTFSACGGGFGEGVFVEIKGSTLIVTLTKQNKEHLGVGENVADIANVTHINRVPIELLPYVAAPQDAVDPEAGAKKLLARLRPKLVKGRTVVKWDLGGDDSAQGVFLDAKDYEILVCIGKGEKARSVSLHVNSITHIGGKKIRRPKINEDIPF